MNEVVPTLRQRAYRIRRYALPMGEVQGEGVGFGADGVVVLTSEGGKKNIPGTIEATRCSL